jgi:hypothetical protein
VNWRQDWNEAVKLGFLGESCVPQRPRPPPLAPTFPCWPMPLSTPCPTTALGLHHGAHGPWATEACLEKGMKEQMWQEHTCYKERSTSSLLGP